jgi:hypothetical protein
LRGKTSENESKKLDSEDIGSINKFSSLNFNSISTTVTNERMSGNIKKFESNNTINYEENEIEDETLNYGYQEENQGIKFGSAINEISSMNSVSNSNNNQYRNQEISKGALSGKSNIFKSGNITQYTKGCLNVNDLIYDESIRIIKYISEGAQAKVYLGLIEEIGKFVAVKRYLLVKADEELIDKVTVECEFVKKLEHTNIIRYFDIEINYYDDITTIDLIMEYVEGFSLKDYLTTDEFVNKLSGEEKKEKIKHIIKNILEGISYLHINKIIHRDLKVI